MKKKAFTLVEIVIVLIIIGILMAIVMGLNRSSIDLLQNKTTNEKVISFFDNIFTQVNSSQYIAEEKYDRIEILVKSGANTIMGNYFSWEKEALPFIQESVEGLLIKEIKIKDEIKDETKIVFHSYNTRCLIWEPESWEPENIKKILKFTLASKGEIESCFQISSNYCRIFLTECKTPLAP